MHILICRGVKPCVLHLFFCRRFRQVPQRAGYIKTVIHIPVVQTAVFDRCEQLRCVFVAFLSGTPFAAILQIDLCLIFLSHNIQFLDGFIYFDHIVFAGQTAYFVQSTEHAGILFGITSEKLFESLKSFFLVTHLPDELIQLIRLLIGFCAQFNPFFRCLQTVQFHRCRLNQFFQWCMDQIRST